MKKLIELGVAIDAAIGAADEWDCDFSFERDRKIRDAFMALPTVDAVPVVHGRWQWVSSTYDRIPCEKRYWCSKCHHETITHDSEPWEKFCPNCGARMDGEQA